MPPARRRRATSPAPQPPAALTTETPSPTAVADRRPRTLHLSRHLAVDRPNNRDKPNDFRIRTHPPPYRVVAAICFVDACLYFALGTEAVCLVLLIVAFRLGPINEMVLRLPPILSMTDFENRRYRVVQSMWLVSICVSIYTLLPEEKRTTQLQGWKLNLVTMETSMSSGIAATYGYSVAGGVPGGLIAEHVMDELGKACVAELTPYLGETVTKATVSFGLFYLMGSIMHACAKCAYAFAHQRPKHGVEEQQHPMGLSEHDVIVAAGAAHDLPHSPSPRAQ